MRLRYIFCKDISGYSKQGYILGLFMYKRRENEYMKKRTIRFCCGVMAAGLLICGIPSGGAERVTQNHLLWNVAAAAETAVTVSNENEFLSALAQKQKNIVVTGSFSVRGQAEASGQMMPVEIPDGTVITGNNTGSITFSGPIQIMGDGVVIRDIQIGFISTNSMNSVPHREIFLAGHSLTLDNVKTYLPGGGDASLGGFGGTEKELLPTIYAGGYHSNTAVGTKASLTVVNANSDTMFQNIYMGHKASAGERTAYTGSVELNLDADAKVRDIISAEDTTSASLVFSGGQNGTDEISISGIKGNANTVLTVKNCAVSDTPLAGVLMGTRCGDIDPSVVTYMEQKLGFHGQEMADYLNKKSGLLGISGVSSDMRDVTSAADAGNERAKLATEMLAYQIKKYVGSYAAAMGGLDCLVFTGGIGENDNRVRASVCENMGFLGISVDPAKNQQRTSDILDISGKGSRVKVLVVCTNEELMIARDTKALVEARR